MIHIRFADPYDGEKLTTLFCSIFRNGSQKGRTRLQRYLTRLYLTPWEGSDFPVSSLVAVEDGAEENIVGFIGGYDTPIRWKGRSLTMAVCGSLMVSRKKADALTGPRLLKRFLAGTQDITFSETASETSQAMWTNLGGEIMPCDSLEWSRSIRPASFALDIAKSKKPFMSVFQPLASLADRALLGRLKPEKQSWLGVPPHPQENIRSTRTKLVELSIEQFASHFQTLCHSYPAYPDFPNKRLALMLEDAAKKRQYGAVFLYGLADRKEDIHGLCLGHFSGQGAMRVLQSVCRNGMEGPLLDALIEAAANKGANVLCGRTSRRFMPAMLSRRFLFHPLCASVIHARDKSVLQPFRQGDGLINGIIGERWNRLNGDIFEDLV